MKGVVDAVNKGLHRANGEILTIQSSDDVFLMGLSRRLLKRSLRIRRSDLIYGDVELIDEKSRVTEIDVQGPFDLAMYFGRSKCSNQARFLRVRRLKQSAAGAASLAIQRMRTSRFESRSVFEFVN